MRKSIFTIILLLSMSSYTIAADDLVSLYQQSDKTKGRSSASYGFGINIPSPYEEGGGGKVIDLSAGLKKSGSCGSFSLSAELKSIFNKEALDQYVNGLIGSIASGAPLLLACYASQTLCDLYKHYRNMANFAVNLRNSQCQQVEKLAQSLGTSLRHTAIDQCQKEMMESGAEFDQAVSECGKKSDLKLNIPGTSGTAETYNLTDSLAQKLSDDPKTVEFIKTVLGDVQFSASYGTSTLKYNKYAEESRISDYTHKYYNGIKTVGSAYKSGGGASVSQGDLDTVSTPGFPITRGALAKLSATDSTTRDNFYRAYASVAALILYTTEFEAAMDALEMEKSATQDETRIKRLDADMKKLERKFNAIQQRVQYQINYLEPMFQTLNNIQLPIYEPGASDEEKTSLTPKAPFKRK